MIPIFFQHSARLLPHTDNTQSMAIVRKILLICFLGQAMICNAALGGNLPDFDDKRLPQAAVEFINRYFPEAKISHVKVEKEFLRIKEYEVLLTDRTEIEFDSNGEWKEVECYKRPVPEELIPDFVRQCIDDKFPSSYVVKIERGRRDIEVELDNDFSLTFNLRGQLIEIDD